MGSSLAAGAKLVFEMARDLDAILILLADQPHATPASLRTLAMTMSLANATIALSDYGDATGPPAIFGSEHFGELATLKGDQGAKAIAMKHPERLVTVSAGEVWDIDTPEAWERFIRSATTSPPSGPR